MTEPDAAPPLPAPDKAGLFEDFIDIFTSPAKVFARRANANAFVPWLIVTLLLVGLFYASRGMMEPLMDGDITRALEQAAKSNPQMTPELIEKSKAMARVTTQWGIVVFIPVGILLLALFTWVVGKVFGGTLSYGTAVMIASYAWIPKVVDSLARMVQGLTMDITKFSSTYQLSASAARFLDPETTSQAMVNLAARADIFVLWTTALLAIGLVSAGKMPKEKGWMAGATMFLLGSITMIWGVIKGG